LLGRTTVLGGTIMLFKMVVLQATMEYWLSITPVITVYIVVTDIVVTREYCM
jgi:hypothetical protein